MKCDELKPIELECNMGKDINGVEYREPWKAYDIDEVDAAIAELKDKCQMHDFFWEGCGFAKRGFKNSIAVSEAFDKLEAENRRLKRALWIARANRALEKIAWFKLWNASISTMNPEDGARQEYDKWKKSLGKFLKKAEEYK